MYLLLKKSCDTIIHLSGQCLTINRELHPGNILCYWLQVWAQQNMHGLLEIIISGILPGNFGIMHLTVNIKGQSISNAFLNTCSFKAMCNEMPFVRAVPVGKPNFYHRFWFYAILLHIFLVQLKNIVFKWLQKLDVLNSFMSAWWNQAKLCMIAKFQCKTVNFKIEHCCWSRGEFCAKNLLWNITVYVKSHVLVEM